LEAECPGGVDKMMGLLEVVTVRDQPAATATYRVELAELFRVHMPAAQALEAAAFYRTELGQKVLMSAGENRSFSNLAQAALRSETGPVDPGAFAADTMETEARVSDELRAELFAAMIDLNDKEWIDTLGRLRPNLQDLSLKYLNAELTAEEDAELEAGFDEILTAHLDECYE